MSVTLIRPYPPGTRVILDDPDYGSWHGCVTVCLCKRHVWQPALQGRECGHAQCGYPSAAAACPWPMHVVWDNGNESHQGDGIAPYSEPVMDPESPLMRDVPFDSGEAAIYSPEYLRRHEGNANGTEPQLWRVFAA